MNKFNLERIREENDLTRKEIANILGVSSSIYSRWENGIDTISTKRLYELANYYEVNIDYLLGLTNNIIHTKSNQIIDYRLVSFRIREIRRDYNESLRTFSKRLNTSNSTWSAYESGKTLILCSFLLEVCLDKNYSADWILCRSDNKYIDKVLVYN